MTNNIDCVILWVDGNDPDWIKKKNDYLPPEKRVDIDASAERFRDFDILRYLFRGLEINADWFRYIFFVTCGQKPEWLNVSHPKLKLIDHKDFIPESYLPTFNSHSIEMNLHRIPGLSEHFVYFNDDMFVLRKTVPEDFFKNGKPCDSAIMNAFAIEKTESEFRFLIPVNNMEIINKHFNKSETLKKFFWKYFTLKYGKEMLRTVCLTPWRHFTGFTINHMPYSLKKSTLETIWEMEPEVLDRTCCHRFRNSNDVNIWLATNWQFATGDFYPRSPKIGQLCCLSDNLQNNIMVYKNVVEHKTKLICINDNVSEQNCEKVQMKIVRAFQKIYPDKSSFEL